MKSAHELFEITKAEIWKRELSNAENFDKTLLTYSTGALALSLGFLKDFIPITQATSGWLLYVSWALFAAVPVITVASYTASQAGLKRQLEISERYYLQNEDGAFNEVNVYAKITEKLNLSSGIFFILGVVFTTIFVSVNLEKASAINENRSSQMNKKIVGDAAPLPSLSKIQGGDLNKGAPIPAVQKIPQPQPAVPAQTPLQPGSSSSGKND